MPVKIPFLIKSLDKIDPKSDRRWVPDGKNIWFLPYVLDLINDNYSGYWYATKTYTEALHYHTGISQGNIFTGEFLLICKNKKFPIQKGQGFVLPSHIPHTAKLIPGKNGFLYFGTVIGKAIYKDDISDVKSYYQDVIKHYKKHKISLRQIFVNK